MDVKSIFLNEVLNEDAYVEQTKKFEDSKYPNHVCKLKKALYGLKQAPRAWHERIAQNLVTIGFYMADADHSL